jgi:hypothetical protein
VDRFGLSNLYGLLASALFHTVRSAIIFHWIEGRYFVQITYSFLNISINFSLETGLIMKSVTKLILFALAISYGDMEDETI